MGRVTPILIFIPVTPASVWIFDKAWLSLLERLFSFLRFVDEFIIPFPPANIILPSRVTLKQCRITLATCPTSVLLLTRRFRVSLSWKSRFWSISHNEVGDCSDGSWRLYSAHRTSLASIPSSSTDLSFPPGNICRIVCSTASEVRNVSVPSITDVNLLDTLYPLQDSTPSFSFFPLDWCRRKLNLDEILFLSNFKPYLFRQLKGKHRQWLLLWA